MNQRPFCFLGWGRLPGGWISVCQLAATPLCFSVFPRKKPLVIPRAAPEHVGLYCETGVELVSGRQLPTLAGSHPREWGPLGQPRCSLGHDRVLPGLLWWNSRAELCQVQCGLSVSPRRGPAAPCVQPLQAGDSPAIVDLSGAPLLGTPVILLPLGLLLCLLVELTVLFWRVRLFKKCDHVLVPSRFSANPYSLWISHGGNGLTSASDFFSHLVVCWLFRDGSCWGRVTSSLDMIY